MRASLKKLFPLLIILSFAFSLHAQETFKVLRVVDGDTLKIDYMGKQESIRLIGIDTPESRVNSRAKRESQRTGEDMKTILAMGKEAAQFVKTLVKAGDKVSIEFDVEKRDKYGRLLGYVYLSNGKMLNEEIVKLGYANLLTIPPNVKYQDRFERAYREARENSRGLWKQTERIKGNFYGNQP
jgi:micrococcal nuclease